MQEIAKTDEGNNGIAEMGLRQDHYAAKEVEKSYRRLDQGVQGSREYMSPLTWSPPPSILIPARGESEPIKQRRRPDDHDDRLPDKPRGHDHRRRRIDHSRFRFVLAEDDETHRLDSRG